MWYLPRALVVSRNALVVWLQYDIKIVKFKIADSIPVVDILQYLIYYKKLKVVSLCEKHIYITKLLILHLFYDIEIRQHQLFYI